MNALPLYTWRAVSCRDAFPTFVERDPSLSAPRYRYSIKLPIRRSVCLFAGLACPAPRAAYCLFAIGYNIDLPLVYTSARFRPFPAFVRTTINCN